MNPETPETPTPEEAGAAVPEEAGAEQQAETDETGKGANAEAARWRTRLRETEGERDGLRDTVERLQRGEVQRLVGADLAQPGDLFDIGRVALADLLDTDGNVDDGLVATAVYGLLVDRPGLGAAPAPRQKGPVITGHGTHSGTTGSDSWQGVLQNRAR